MLKLSEKWRDVINHILEFCGIETSSARMMNPKKRPRGADAGENLDPQQAPATRSTKSRGSSSTQPDGLQCEGGSRLQTCGVLCIVNGCESMGPIGGCSCNQLSDQPADQSTKPVDDVASNLDLQQCRYRTNFFRKVEDIILNRSIPHPEKVSLFREDLRELLSNEDQKAEGDMDNLEHDAQVEISKLENECHAAHEARSLCEQKFEVLQKSVVKMLEENQDLKSKLVCQDTETAEDSGNQGETVKQLPETEILARILSLTSELQKRSQEDESFRLNLSPGIANGEVDRHQALEPGAAHGLEQISNVCGSYTDRYATPKLLDGAFSTFKSAVTRLLKAVFDSEVIEQHRVWDLPKLDVFARPKHVMYYSKAVMNKMFFNGFENESFQTSCGVPKFLDPELRQATFYAYYRADNAGKDPQFEEFCKMKGSELIWTIAPERTGEINVESCLDEIGGPQLSSSFRAVAKSLWLLHKLAFSFEPPASIFRVPEGTDVDPNYMKTLVNIDDHERFVAKVGFMITPGLRVGKTVMPCEVYLLSA